MAHFTITDNGRVNLGHVTKILRIANAETGSEHFEFLDARGEVLGTRKCSPEDIDLDPRGTEQLFPAQPGFNALLYCGSCGTLTRMPILAWQRSTTGRLAPIAVDGSIEHNAIELPDGRVFDGELWWPDRTDYLDYLHDPGAQLPPEH